MRGFVTVLVACAALPPAAVQAQRLTVDPASHPAMSHRHGVELGMGLLAGVDAGTSTIPVGATVEAQANGLMGSLTFLYRIDDNLLITASAGGLSVDASVSASGSNATVESSSVSMLLFGARYLLPALGRRGVVRPYASLGAGPYVGVVSHVRTSPTASVGSRTEIAPGARLGLGVTAGFNSWLTAGLGAGYHLVGDFDERIGAETNYSGPDFMLAFGLRYGTTTLE